MAHSQTNNKLLKRVYMIVIQMATDMLQIMIYLLKRIVEKVILVVK